jgi:serine/threonine protein kinase
MSSKNLDLKKGLMIGNWRLDKLIGSGGQGEVWKVYYNKENHSPPGALKICTNTDTTSKSQERFNQEIALLRNQKHENIVRIRDSNIYDNHPFYVMELATTDLSKVVEAKTAGTRLVRESGPLLIKFIRQACSALSSLHEQGILHRDIKPSNILLMLDTPDPMKAVLADLGIATPEIEQGRITATQEVVGTPTYRAPESLTDKHTQASDIYSFGKTLEFLFTGAQPTGYGPSACYRSHIFSNDLWEHFDEILRKACAYDPKERFRSGQELLDALPEVTVIGVGKSNRVRPLPEIVLKDYEKIVLCKIIEFCPSETNWVWTRHIIGKKADQIDSMKLAFSLDRLMELNLIESKIEQDDGEEFTVYRQTKTGLEWARLNVRLENNVPKIIQVVIGEDEWDDVPF